MIDIKYSYTTSKILFYLYKIIRQLEMKYVDDDILYIKRCSDTYTFMFPKICKKSLHVITLSNLIQYYNNLYSELELCDNNIILSLVYKDIYPTIINTYSIIEHSYVSPRNKKKIFLLILFQVNIYKNYIIILY